MTRARNFADVISGQFDIPAGSLTNAVPADGSITTAKLADDAVTEAKVADGVIKDSGRRNLILNGAMQVWQRGTTIDTITSGGFLCDRWRIAHNGTDGNVDVDRSTDVPSGEGFGYSQKISMDASEASLDAGDQVNIQHRFEGQDLQLLEKGSASAKEVTLSFWVKSSVAATYSVNLVDNDNTRIIGATYVINSANTWEKKTITFDGDTSGTLDNDANRSLDLRFWLDTGTTYTSGTFATSWGASSDAVSASATTGWLESSSPEFYITGVQLEVSDSATDFEHRSYGSELSACQRYFVGGMHFMCFGRGYSPSSVGNSAPVLWPTTMRTTPTITKSNEGDGGGSQTTMVFGSTRATGTNPEAESTNNTDTNYVTADITADAEL